MVWRLITYFCTCQVRPHVYVQSWYYNRKSSYYSSLLNILRRWKILLVLSLQYRYNYQETYIIYFISNVTSLKSYRSSKITQTFTLRVIYISFKSLLTKEWPEICILYEFGWGHNQTPKVVSYIQKIACMACKN